MKKVLLIDSGVGGVNILKECVKVTPNCEYLLFCDLKNSPYGNKTKNELLNLTIENLNKIYSFFKFEIVIFACNTLTCTCLEECRNLFKDKIFIGTVPAIKPAIEKYDERDILVLATQATINHNILINKHKNLKTLAMPTLASDIDKNLSNLDVLKNEIAEKLKNIDVKAVVLGCTHYKAVKEFIKSALGGDIDIFDSENGVARRLKSFVEKENFGYQVQIMLSDKQEQLPILWDYFYQ